MVIIIIVDCLVEIEQLRKHLGLEFKIRVLTRVKCFSCIEVSSSFKERNFLYHNKICL